MSNTVAIRNGGNLSPAGGDIMESVIIKGDLSKLTPNERGAYYMRVCESVGLNPLTKPFEYITLNGKLTLYALRACTDQIRTIHKVSVEELTETERDGVFIVTAKVRNGEGRTDMAKGAVTISNLKGEALANAMMKAETKAKRRATLSLCGLGFLDETEIETIPAAAKRTAAPIELPKPPHNPRTGEIIEASEGIPGFLDRREKSAPVQIALPTAKDGATDWIKFGQAYIAAVQSAKTLAEADAWHDANESHFHVMRQDAPKVYARMMDAIAKHRATLVTDADMLSEDDMKEPVNILQGG